MAEREITIDLPTIREQIIAQVRAYADWLEANPDVPAPTQLQGTNFQHAVPSEESIAIVRGLERKHGAVIKTNSGSGWAVIYPLPPGPLNTEHTVFANPPKRQESWL